MSDVSNGQDKEFLLYIIKSLVSKPDAVIVDRKVDEMGVLLTLTVDPEDMGKIIGREGNTAKALRTLLRLFGAKANTRVNMKINEPVREGEEGENTSSDSEVNQDKSAPSSVLDDDLEI